MRGLSRGSVVQDRDRAIEFMSGVAGDERGLVADVQRVRGRHMPGTTNETVYEAVPRVEAF